jgi:hypothetical protein
MRYMILILFLFGCKADDRPRTSRLTTKMEAAYLTGTAMVCYDENGRDEGCNEHHTMTCVGETEITPVVVCTPVSANRANCRIQSKQAEAP